MQTANLMVAIGGDRDNTVPRYGVTAAEVAVLQAIHGPDAVFDIEPGEDVDTNNRDELRRLREVYSSVNARPLVEALYPGAAARVFENLSELDVTEEQYKAETRKTSRKSAAKAAPAPAPAPAKKVSKADKKRQDAVNEATDAGVARPQNQEAVDDGIADMPDSGILD